jgi:hypothetical protein
MSLDTFLHTITQQHAIDALQKNPFSAKALAAISRNGQAINHVPSYKLGGMFRGAPIQIVVTGVVSGITTNQVLINWMHNALTNSGWSVADAKLLPAQDMPQGLLVKAGEFGFSITVNGSSGDNIATVLSSFQRTMDANGIPVRGLDAYLKDQINVTVNVPINQTGNSSDIKPTATSNLLAATGLSVSGLVIAAVVIGFLVRGK